MFPPSASCGATALTLSGELMSTPQWMRCSTMSGCPVRVATWRGVLSSLTGKEMNIRGHQHPPLLTQHRASPGPSGHAHAPGTALCPQALPCTPCPSG